MWKALSNVVILLSFSWTKAHNGTAGNEQADRAAKAALYLKPSLSRRKDKTDLTEYVEKLFMDKWQSLWDEPRTKGGRFVKDHSPFVSRIAAIYAETRSEQVFITRVRLDQLPLNKNLHRWKKHPTGKCTRCILHKAETVRHI